VLSSFGQNPASFELKILFIGPPLGLRFLHHQPRFVAETTAEENALQFQFNGMYYTFTNTQLLVSAFVLLLAIGIAIAAFMEHRRTKTLALRNRFGTEYDREVLKHSSAHAAESKLADREIRFKALEISNLGAVERERFVIEWHTVQSRFVDHPHSAVTEADDLINALLEARGYPHATFEQRAADVSVSYPRVMEDYRLAHGIAYRLGKVEATTEELRTAMIQYRSIFDELAQPLKPTEQKSAA